MKNMINIRNGIIIILCITIVFLGVGFILLSVRLKEYKDRDNRFNVEFQNLKLANSVKGSSIEPTCNAEINSSKQEITMNYSLNSTHDEITYTTSIVNNGDIAAEIVDIMESPNYKSPQFNKLISPVTITITDVKGKILPPGEKLDLKITAYYNPSTNPVTNKTFTYKLGIIVKSK